MSTKTKVILACCAIFTFISLKATTTDDRMKATALKIKETYFVGDNPKDGVEKLNEKLDKDGVTSVLPGANADQTYPICFSRNGESFKRTVHPNPDLRGDIAPDSPVGKVVETLMSSVKNGDPSIVKYELGGEEKKAAVVPVNENYILVLTYPLSEELKDESKDETIKEKPATATKESVVENKEVKTEETNTTSTKKPDGTVINEEKTTTTTVTEKTADGSAAVEKNTESVKTEEKIADKEDKSKGNKGSENKSSEDKRTEAAEKTTTKKTTKS